MLTYSFPHPQILHVSFRQGSTSEDAQQFFQIMTDFLAQGRPFCLIVETDGESPFPQEERKKLAIWFKQNKTVLAQSCLGLARLTHKVSLMERLSGQAFRLMMPCPYFITSEAREALQWTMGKIKSSLH